MADGWIFVFRNGLAGVCMAIGRLFEKCIELLAGESLSIVSKGNFMTEVDVLFDTV